MNTRQKLSNSIHFVAERCCAVTLQSKVMFVSATIATERNDLFQSALRCNGPLIQFGVALVISRCNRIHEKFMGVCWHCVNSFALPNALHCIVPSFDERCMVFTRRASRFNGFWHGASAKNNTKLRFGQPHYSIYFILLEGKRA